MCVFKYFNSISKLASVNRYSDYRMVNDESVLEHTAFVGIISLFIGAELLGEKETISFGLLLPKALLHDFDEAATGDIAMPVKYYSPKLREEIAKMESSAVENISIDLFGNSFLYDIWGGAKLGREGKIVALADALAVVYKIHDEVVLRGNKTMIVIAKNVQKILFSKFESLQESLKSDQSPFLNSMYEECDECLESIIDMELLK